MLAALSQDVLVQILKGVAPGSVVAAEQTCQTIRAAAQDDATREDRRCLLALADMVSMPIIGVGFNGLVSTTHNPGDPPPLAGQIDFRLPSPPTHSNRESVLCYFALRQTSLFASKTACRLLGVDASLPFAHGKFPIPAIDEPLANEFAKYPCPLMTMSFEPQSSARGAAFLNALFAMNAHRLSGNWMSESHTHIHLDLSDDAAIGILEVAHGCVMKVATRALRLALHSESRSLRGATSTIVHPYVVAADVKLAIEFARADVATSFLPVAGQPIRSSHVTELERTRFIRQIVRLACIIRIDGRAMEMLWSFYCEEVCAFMSRLAIRAEHMHRATRSSDSSSDDEDSSSDDDSEYEDSSTCDELDTEPTLNGSALIISPTPACVCRVARSAGFYVSPHDSHGNTTRNESAP